jgi:hypothetical protein
MAAVMQPAERLYMPTPQDIEQPVKSPVHTGAPPPPRGNREELGRIFVENRWLLIVCTISLFFVVLTWKKIPEFQEIDLGELGAFVFFAVFLCLITVFFLRFFGRLLAITVSSEIADQKVDANDTKEVHQLKQMTVAIRDLHTWHAFIIGTTMMMLTLLGLWLAWLEGQSGKNRRKYEQNQTIFQLNKNFEDIFDLEVRRRYYRVDYLFAEESRSNRQSLAEDLDASNVFLANEDWLNLPEHATIKRLILPDLDLEYAKWASTNSVGARNALIQTEISDYHAVLVKVINVLDTIALMRQSGLDGHVPTPYIDESLWYSVTNGGWDLKDFINRNRLLRNTNDWQYLFDATQGRKIH